MRARSRAHRRHLRHPWQPRRARGRRSRRSPAAATRSGAWATSSATGPAPTSASTSCATAAASCWPATTTWRRAAPRTRPASRTTPAGPSAGRARCCGPTASAGWASLTPAAGPGADRPLPRLAARPRVGVRARRGDRRGRRSARSTAAVVLCGHTHGAIAALLDGARLSGGRRHPRPRGDARRDRRALLNPGSVGPAPRRRPAGVVPAAGVPRRRDADAARASSASRTTSAARSARSRSPACPSTSPIASASACSPAHPPAPLPCAVDERRSLARTELEPSPPRRRPSAPRPGRSPAGSASATRSSSPSAPSCPGSRSPRARCRSRAAASTPATARSCCSWPSSGRRWRCSASCASACCRCYLLLAIGLIAIVVSAYDIADVQTTGEDLGLGDLIQADAGIGLWICLDRRHRHDDVGRAGLRARPPRRPA